MKNIGILEVLVLTLLSLSFSNCKPEKHDRIIHIVKYPNGNIKSISQTLNEKNDGIRYEYYPNRQLMSKENWVEGFKNGKALSFYENGTIETEGSYLRDKKNGCWQSYYPNGKTRSFHEYLADTTAKDPSYLNRYINFDSLGNVDLSIKTLYWEALVIDTNNEKSLRIHVKYVPANTNYRIIYNKNSSQNDTIEGHNNSLFLIPIGSGGGSIYGEVQCYTQTYELNGKMIYDTYDSYFDTKRLGCNIE